jgi:uncharacterized protein (DUF885 family)
MADTGADRRLHVDEEIDAWLAEEFDRRPVAAGALGLDHFNFLLDDLSAARLGGEPARTRRWTARLGLFDEEQLAVDDLIDVKLVLSELAGRQVMEDWLDWRRDPAVYVEPCLHSAFDLFVNRSAPEPQLVAAAVSRLRQVPAAAADAIANLDPEVTPPLLLERGIAMCRAGAAYFANLLPGEVGDLGLRAQVADAGGAAATALSGLATHLRQLRPRAAGDWAVGEGRYSALLRRRELLHYDAGRLQTRGEEVWAQLDAEMADVARRVDPDAPGWQAVVSALAAEHPADPDAMRRAYETATADARRFCAERQLVTFAAGERCLVVPSPVFQRPVLAVASYQSPPPISALRTGHFFVPYPPEGTSPEELDQRLADNGTFAIPSVAVHEAYPGHHWQLTWSSQAARPVRHWVSSSYFVEGWALYAERLMREEGYFADPREELMHLSMRIFRAVRMIVDPALHCGGMTPEEAAEQLVNRAGMTRAVARAEVDRYCAWPTQAPSYLAGSLEIEAIRDRWREGPGAGRPLRQFHDAVAASPGLPPALSALALGL